MSHVKTNRVTGGHAFICVRVYVCAVCCGGWRWQQRVEVEILSKGQEHCGDIKLLHWGLTHATSLDHTLYITASNVELNKKKSLISAGPQYFSKY